MTAASQMQVLYDRDCGFCRFSIALLLAWDRRRRLGAIAIQSPEGQRLLAGLPEDVRLRSAHAVAGDGAVRSGGAAAAPLVGELPGGRPLARLAEAAPGLTERTYRAVADRRGMLGRLIPRGARRWADRSIEDRARIASRP